MVDVYAKFGLEPSTQDFIGTEKKHIVIQINNKNGEN